MNNTARTAQLEDMKHQIGILDLATRLGLQIRGRQARCFNSKSHKHNDRNYSLGLDIKTNRYKCFTCNEAGSIIDLYMSIKGVDFKQALEELKGIYNIREDSPQPYKYSTPKVEKPTSTQIDTRYRVYKSIMEHTGTVTDQAREYLTGRGIEKDTITRFKLCGIADYQRLNTKLKEEFSIEELREAGVIGDKNNLIFYKHTLLIPFLEGERVVFYQGRRLDNENPKYLLLKDIQIPLFNTNTLTGLAKDERVYICEGVFDALVMEQEGYHAVAILGVNNFKPEWV